MRRLAVALLSLALLAAPLAVDGQPAARVYRVGVLGVHLTSASALLYEAVRAGLRDHGYVEGRNLALEFRWAEERTERLPALAAELISLPVDVLVAVGDLPASVAKAATRTTPIVFTWSADPVRRGLVASLARPGGNLTGLAYDTGPELWAKSLELIKETMPGTSRVAILANVADPAGRD